MSAKQAPWRKRSLGCRVGADFAAAALTREEELRCSSVPPGCDNIPRGVGRGKRNNSRTRSLDWQNLPGSEPLKHDSLFFRMSQKGTIQLGDPHA